MAPRRQRPFVCNAAAPVRRGDIYKPIKMVIDYVFVSVYTRLFSLSNSRWSFEQGVSNLQEACGRIRWKAACSRSHQEEFHSFSRPSTTPHSLAATRLSSPSSRVILFAPHLSVRLHLQDAVISLARLDVYCEAEIENGL